jgi:glycosyltransferase involved in cell wall biosynthesis
VIVDQRWPHHSPHSGYHFINHIPGAATISCVTHGDRGAIALKRTPDGESPRLRIRGRWVQVPLSKPLLKGILSGRYWYPPGGLIAEARVLTRMLWSTRTVYHLTCVEEHYGILGRVGWPRRCKVVATFHQSPDRLWSFFKSDRYLRRLDGAIAVASNQLETLRELVGPERVFLVPHGVDTSYWRPASGQLRRGRNRTILSVGSHLRDFDTMQKVAESLRERWREALDLVIVTSARHAGRLASWPGVQVRVGIDESELRNRYRSADVTLIPLRDGTVNNAMLESLACGTPVVMSDVGAARDLPDDGGALVTVPTGDPEAMTRAVVSILEGSRQEDRSIRARRLGESLDWSNVARELIDVYRHFLN